MGKVVRGAMDAAVSYDRGDERCRCDVERGIVYVGVSRRRRAVTQHPNFVRMSLLDVNVVTRQRLYVDGAGRSSDIKGNSMMLRRNRKRVRADLVRDVAVCRDAIGAHDDEVDPALRH